MGKGSNDQVVRQESEPWAGVQGPLTQLYPAAQNAFNQVNRQPFQGDLYAGPTGAQLMGQQGVVDTALNYSNYAGQGAGMAQQAVQGMLAQNPNQGYGFQNNVNSNNYGSYNPGSVGFGSYSTGQGPEFQSFNPQAYTSGPSAQFGTQSTQNFNPQQRFNQLTLGNQQPFSFQQQELMPTGAYGGVGQVAQGIRQVAGQGPQLGNSGLEAAINAAVNPLQRRFEEQLLPDLKNQFVSQGTSGNSRAGFNVANQFEQALTRPAQEIASQLAFQDYTRQAQQGQERYLLEAQLGAQAAENQANRQSQDLAALRDQQLQQQQFTGQLGLQDLSQRRQLGAQDIARRSGENLQWQQGLNQLGLQDVMQQRDLGFGQQQSLNQLGLEDLMQQRQLGFGSNQQFNDIMAQQQGLNNQLNNQQWQLQQQLGQQNQSELNQLNLAQQQGLNQLGMQNLSQMRGLQQGDTQFFNQLMQGDLNQRRQLGTQNNALMLQAAGMMPGLEQAQFEAAMRPWAAISGVGAEQQGFNQGFLNEGLQRYQMQQQAPWSGFSELTSILHGNPYSSSTQTSPGPSQMGQFLQGGLGAAGLGASLFPGAASSIGAAGSLGGALGAFASGPLMPLAILGGLAGAL